MNKIPIQSNIQIDQLIVDGGVFRHSGETYFAHNIVLDCAKNYILRCLAGMEKFPEIRYMGIGRSSLPTGGAPAASSAAMVSLSDPNPYYIPVTSVEKEDGNYFKEIVFVTIVIGTPALFDHFQIGLNSLSIGEIGLFFGDTVSDTGWGVSESMVKGDYAIFARNNILETRSGSPLVLKRSQTANVYEAWMCRWSASMP